MIFSTPSITEKVGKAVSASGAYSNKENKCSGS